MDGLERDWGAGQIIRLDVLTTVGREFGAWHGFEFTPTFILFDGEGRAVARWRAPPSLGELDALSAR